MAERATCDGEGGELSQKRGRMDLANARQSETTGRLNEEGEATKLTSSPGNSSRSRWRQRASVQKALQGSAPDPGTLLVGHATSESEQCRHQRSVHCRTAQVAKLVVENLGLGA